MFLFQKKKRWNKNDIELLLQQKQAGKKLKELGSLLGVSANAISKALQRYSPEYTHPDLRHVSHGIEGGDDQIQQIDAAICWAKSHNIPIQRNMDGEITLNGSVISSKHAILHINRYRIYIGKIPFQITFW